MERVAFLTLENLSGEEALDWLREAVPTMAASQLAGRPPWQPSRAKATRDAALADAHILVHGYFERRAGRLRFTFSIEDAETHRLQSIVAEGGALEAAAAAARALDPGAAPFATAVPEAVEAWGRREFARATSLDPDFGLAWRDWIQQQSPADPTAALALAQQALARPGLKSPIDRAQIQLIEAGLRGDRQAEVRAGRDLLKLVPNDAALTRQLAELATNTRQFTAAVELYQTLTRLEPDEASHLNQLGYAQFFAGDLKSALASLERYAGLPGQAANGLDSQGEVLFMAGRFAEAEPLFLKSHETNPSFLGGSGLLKAAYARWLAGDLPGADGIFEKYMQFRVENRDQAAEWRRAAWEYSTGRAPQAVARLRRITGPMAQLATSQLKVWENAPGIGQDLAAVERAYRQTPPAADGLARTLYARGLWRAGKRDEAAALLEPWPLPGSGDPLLESLLYPWYVELRKQVGK